MEQSKITLDENEMCKNPFTEVEKGVRSCDLSAFHPYWDNYVKVRKIFDCIREQEKLNSCKGNRYLFDREFSKNTSPESIQMKIDKKLTECYGAMSSLNYVMERPSGVALKII